MTGPASSHAPQGVPQTLAQEEHRLRAQLDAHATTRSLTTGRLSHLVGGLSNLSWRLDDAAGDAWFVRRGHPQAERLGVDRRSECAVLQHVAAAGFAPAVRCCDPDGGLLVTRFVAGRAWERRDAREPSNYRRLAALLRRLHELPVPAGIRAVDFVKQARHLAADIDSSSVAATLAREGATALQRLERREKPGALCHHDVHHLNVLDDGTRLWLVDWEYAGRGDPLFDVAGFLCVHDLDETAASEFIQAYGGLPAGSVELLNDACWIFDYVQWLWYRLRFGSSPDAVLAARIDGLAQRLLRCDNRRLLF